MVKSLNKGLILVHKLFVGDSVDNVETGNALLEELDHLDGVGDSSTGGIEVHELVIIGKKDLSGVGAVREVRAVDPDSDLVGLGWLGVLHDLPVLRDGVLDWQIGRAHV